MNMNLEMNLPTVLALSATGISLISLLAAFVCYRQYRKSLGLLEFATEQINQLSDSSVGLQENVENSTKKASDHSRRIAWLESRVRQPRLIKQDAQIDENAVAQPVKWNMSERRHRLLKLASSGQSTERIASTLGLMPGEVELIINLNRANYASA